VAWVARDDGAFVVSDGHELSVVEVGVEIEGDCWAEEHEGVENVEGFEWGEVHGFWRCWNPCGGA